MHQATLRVLRALCGRFLFWQGYLEFHRARQREGAAAVRRRWRSFPCRNPLFPLVLEIYEGMAGLSEALGLTCGAAFEGARGERRRLQFEHDFLMETLAQLRRDVVAAGDELLWTAWNHGLAAGIGTGGDRAALLAGLLMPSGTRDRRGADAPRVGDREQRRQIRHVEASPVEFLLTAAGATRRKGIILNASDFGLCLFSSLPLGTGQEIFLARSALAPPRAYTVRWSRALVAGLAA